MTMEENVSQTIGENHIAARETGRLDPHCGLSSWRTPSYLFDPLDAEFKFDFDPCPANPPFPEFNGLECEWRGKVFVNPPYGTWQTKFLSKAIEEIRGLRCNVAVFLLCAHTECAWFHEWVLRYSDEIRFIRPQVWFVKPTGEVGTISFPSFIAVFNRHSVERVFGYPKVTSWYPEKPHRKDVKPMELK
jgi:hypothetical protein